MENIELGNIETSSSASEWKEVSQEDLVRVSEQVKKWNKYWWQIKSASIQNNKYAKFLQYLIINIWDDQFWKLAEIFDVEPDNKISIWEQNQTFLARLLCGFMAPVFPEQADQDGLWELFQEKDYHISKTFLDYLSYVQEFGKTDQNIWRIDQDGLNQFVKYILVHFGFEDNQKLTGQINNEGNNKLEDK